MVHAQATTAFRFDLRIVVCQHCGAPVESVPTGGWVTCHYCNAGHQVTARVEAMLEPEVRAVDENLRLATLRQQDGRPLIPPASLQPLIENNKLMPWKEQEALAVWRSTCDELRRGDSFEAAERLLVLTMLLSNHYAGKKEPLRQRALFESALDVFRLPRHRQVMRGFLARNAAYTNDVDGAERWLAPCNPRSMDLEADSAYRISRATIDTAKGNWVAVLQTLGRFHNDVPIMDVNDPTAVVLRANAHERLGDLASATIELQRYPSAAIPTILQVLAADHGWHLCQASLPMARAKAAKELETTAKVVGGGIAALTLGPFVLVAIIFAAVFLVIIAAVVIVMVVAGAAVAV